MKLKSKKEFLSLSSEGKLGNFLKIYKSLTALKESKYNKFLTIRALDKASEFFVAVIRAQQVEGALENIRHKGGGGPENYYFQQIPSPTAIRRYQLEGMQTHKGVALYYETNTREPLRGIRERGKFIEGLRASSILGDLLPSSQEMLYSLWEQYPSSIIEATEFNEDVGEYNLPMVIWEVRDF